METSDDIKILTDILEKKTDQYSDTGSIDSNELVIDCELWDDDLIKNCTNPILKNTLICNLKKRKALGDIIDKIEDHLIKLKHVYKENRTEIFDRKSLKDPRRVVKRLGAPYFKDSEAFFSPANADWYKMKENNQLVGRKNFIRNMWTTEDKHKLSEGVYREICCKKLQEIKVELEILRSKKKIDEKVAKKIESLEYEEKVFSDVELIRSLIAKWQINRIKSADGKSATDSKYLAEELIIKTICEWKNNINWYEISSRYLDCRRTEKECQAMWNCHVNPKFSKDIWKVSENKLLTELVEKHNYQNWDAIAQELGDYRSAYQCCVHFNAKLCEKFNRDKWTPEEDHYLQSVIESCSVGNYISWGKVSYFFKTRTKMQIYRHYMSCFTKQIKKGNFSLEEDALLLTVMKVYGSNLKKINRYFPNRNLEQLRNRMNTLNTDVSRAWTAQDDAKIIAYVGKYGERNWKKLVEETNRSAGCIRHRYNIIRKYYELNPGTSVMHIPRRAYTNYRVNIRKRQVLVAKVVQKLLDILEHTSNKASVLNVKYIQSIIAPLIETEEKKKRGGQGKPPININSLLYDFFKSSYKCVNRNIGRNRKIDDDSIDESAERVDVFLNLLGANLVFPSLDEINNHKMLDDVDKLILNQIIKNRQEPLPSTSSNHYQNLSLIRDIKCIPPSVESLVGFRGILLHMNILKSHARGNYEGYSLYVKSGPNERFPVNGYNYNKAILDCKLMKYNESTKEVVRQEEQLFFKRLKLLFQWPYVMADTKAEPVYDRRTVPVTNEPKEKQKVGRKPRNVKHARVLRMVEMRKQAFLEKKRLQEATDEVPNKKIKIEPE